MTRATKRLLRTYGAFRRPDGWVIVPCCVDHDGEPVWVEFRDILLFKRNIPALDDLAFRGLLLRDIDFDRGSYGPSLSA